MRYSLDHLKKFTPIYAEDIARHVSPDALLLFDKSNEHDNIFKINYYFAALHLERKKKEFLGHSIVETILKKPLPNPQQQVDNLIRLLSEFYGVINFEWSDFMYYTGSQHYDMFHALIEYLQDRKWISGQGYKHGMKNGCYYGTKEYTNIMLTVQGWERFAQLQKGELSRNKGFMAMQFSNDDLQSVLAHHFKPAMKRIGFELTKLDDNHKPELIDTRMLVEIQTSDFIVADLSDDNRGVYFEAGYAMGLGKTVIFTCEKTAWETGDVHFDVNHYQVIRWNKESPEDAAEKLALSVRAEFPDKVKTPDDE